MLCAVNSFIRQLLVYFLIVLLPFQAAAASRLSLCAEMKMPGHTMASMSDHCAQLAVAAEQSGKTGNSQQHPKQAGCWLGSICLAGMIGAAIPTNHRIGSVKPSSYEISSVATHYRSVDLDDPQRPPTAL